MKLIRPNLNTPFFDLVDEDDNVIVRYVLVGMYVNFATEASGRVHATIIFNEVGNIF